ncbi:MAG: hypothetical protein M1376_11100 [Planctomycetes bacterium]|nr:hypothetical protein [Planctomycetota bacterium]
MGDAAHAESLDHEVFRAPFTVQPEFELWDTPDNYKRNHLGSDRLPARMKVWRVQKTGQEIGGVVARGEGFTDSPDAEVLALGFNTGKSYGDVGIGRQGSFLQWGYSAPPSQMTEPGQKLFLNCIHYIRKFDGKAPLLRCQTIERSRIVVLAGAINRVRGDRKAFFLWLFPEELYEKYHSDPGGLAAYYKANLELVYHDKVYRIDDDLKSLGIESNRKIESLQRLIKLLDDAEHAATVRRMLGHYTDQSFDTPQQWRQWFEESENRIYFTDVGGYKFKVVPEGYLTMETAKK